jgi:hypothetical protein
VERKGPQPAPVFRHWPVLYAVIAVGLLFLYALLVLVQRAVAGSIESASAVFGGLSLLAGVCGLLSMGWDMARAHSTFRITPTHLIVTAWPGFRQHQLSWVSVKRAERLRKRWWARGGEAELAAIQTTEGPEIWFMPHLLRDSPRFIAELKAHGVRVELD